MKRVIKIFLWFLFATIIFACNKAPKYIEDGKKLGVGIAVLGDWNGDGVETILYWAPVNCGYKEEGAVNSRSDHRLGKVYQWGAEDSSLPYYNNREKIVARAMYYDDPTPSPWYNEAVIKGASSDKWNNNQGPCPEGWRLPTSTEFKVLCEGKNERYGWSPEGIYSNKSNVYAGAEFFGVNSTMKEGKGVFFPAAGSRSSDKGRAQQYGSYGCYWTSTLDQGASCKEGHSVFFSSSDLDTRERSDRACALSVRCVSGEGDPQGAVHPPVVLTTTEPENLTNRSAVCGGNIISAGDSPITERGICFSANNILPSVETFKNVDSDTCLGLFQCELALPPGFAINVRAYAINANGVYYGELQTVRLPSPNYIENGINLGESIAVIGDWNGDGEDTILFWAPVNCGYEEVGEINTDSDHRLGKLYQWGAGDSGLYGGIAREMYYDTATPSLWHNYITIVGTKYDRWNNNQGPCPEGWRLPTPREIQVLCSGKNGRYGWVSNGTYAGKTNTYSGAEFFGDNADMTAGKGVFFPAAGYRSETGGNFDSRGSNGCYWSSTPDPSNNSYAAQDLYFGSSNLSLHNTYTSRVNYQSVRCVSE